MSSSKAKKILFVYPTLFHPQYGGVERVTDLLTKELLKRSYNVIYLHTHTDPSLANYDYPAPVYFFPMDDYNSKENVNFYHNFLRENKIDIIINQCGNFSDSRLFLDTGNRQIKIISVLHSTPLLNYKHLSSELLQLRKSSLIEYYKLFARTILYFRIKRKYFSNRVKHFNFLFQNTDIVCLLSSQFISDLKIVYFGDLKSKVRVIANPNSYSNKTDCVIYKHKQLLYVGRLTKGEKRPDRLLKIWRQLYQQFPDWELIIVGDGPMRNWMEMQSKKMERITFVGYQDPLSYYKNASLFCMTSNYEGFPMVLPETMTFGTVPIAFNSFTAIKDIIEDNKNGVLVTPFSINEYVEKLKMLMENAQLREQMGRECIEGVKKISITEIVNQWERLFNEILK